MNHTPHNDGANVNLDGFVGYISCDTRLGKEFDIFAGANRARYRTVNHYMRDINFAFHLGNLGQDQRTGLAAGGFDVSPDMSINTQAATESDITFYDGARADQAVDGTWFVGFSEHEILPVSYTHLT